MGSVMDDVFGGGQNKAWGDIGQGYAQAEQMRQQMLQQALGYLQPYLQGGQQMYNQAMPQYSAYINNLGNSLAQSFGYGGANPSNMAGAPHAMGFNPNGANATPANNPSNIAGANGGNGIAPSMPGQYSGIQSWMNNYQMSPQAQFEMKNALRAANNSQAASGMIGTPAGQQDQMQIAQGITSEDMNNYYNQLMGQQNAYLGGLGNMMNAGYMPAAQAGQWAIGTGSGMANDLINQGAAAGYGDVANSNMWNNLLGYGLGMI